MLLIADKGRVSFTTNNTEEKYGMYFSECARLADEQPELCDFIIALMRRIAEFSANSPSTRSCWATFLGAQQCQLTLPSWKGWLVAGSVCEYEWSAANTVGRWSLNIHTTLLQKQASPSDAQGVNAT